MANLKIRYLVVIFLLVVTASVVNGLQYNSSQDAAAGLVNLQKIPMQFDKWQGQDFSLDEMVYDILETKAIIHRSFTAENGDNVFLSIVHYHDTKVDFHAPEACLGGRGVKTMKVTKALSLFSGSKKVSFDVAEIVTMRSDGKTLTYYFFKAGQFFGSDYIKMRLSIAANKLFRNDSRGSLIRVSTTLAPGNKAGAEKLLTGFLEDLLPFINKSL